jgi:hypothetical protein
MTTPLVIRPDALAQQRSLIVTRLAIASTAVALTLSLAKPAIGQGIRTTLAAETTTGAFLTPLPSRFLMSPEDPRVPRVCRRTSSPIKCPSFLAYGGAADDLPTIDAAFKADLPHVRVTFVVQRVENEIVANGGVNLGVYSWPWVSSTSSSAASVETDFTGYVLPKPDDVWDDGLYFRVYDALVFNACETFSVFPVDHTASILKSDGSEIAGFHGVDNTTLDELGFYSFQYTVRVEGDGGRVSDFHFAGEVSVTCSGLDALP